MKKVPAVLVMALIALPILAEQNIAILPCAPQSISCPATISSATTIACRNLEGDGGFGTTQVQNLYSFAGTAGESVTVNLTAASAEDVQFEFWQEGSWISTVMYGEGCTAEPCMHRTLTRILPTSGTWLIAVHTYLSAKEVTDVAGRFTLAVSCTPPQLPNLMPYAVPSTVPGHSWPAPIIVSNVTGTHSDALAPNDTVYVDLAMINTGAPTSTYYYTALYLDGTFLVAGLITNPVMQVNSDFQIGPLALGTHTLRMVVDYTNLIAESDETDNEYVKTFTVSANPCSTDQQAIPPYFNTLYPSAVCLQHSRFKVKIDWDVPTTSGCITSFNCSGFGVALPLSDDTGYFYFFSANNIEVTVKVLDGTATNSHFWVFASGMTNVHTVMTVTDLVTGAVKTYTNPQGTAFQPIQDTLAFTP